VIDTIYRKRATALRNRRVCGFTNLFWEGRGPSSGRIFLFEFDVRDEDNLCPNFCLDYHRTDIFAFNFTPPQLFTSASVLISTSEQIDSISILLRSAGGRTLFCRTKLIVSLRWNHSARSTAKVRNAIDSSRHRWSRDRSLLATPSTSQLFEAYRKWHDRQKPFFQNLRNCRKEDYVLIWNIRHTTLLFVKINHYKSNQRYHKYNVKCSTYKHNI